MVLDSIPGPEIDADSPLQMLCTTLDWSEYVGRIAIGRIHSGRIKSGQRVALMQSGDRTTMAKITNVQVFDKLGRADVEEATAGDIAAVIGLENIEIGDTISDAEQPRALARAWKSINRRSR